MTNKKNMGCSGFQLFAYPVYLSIWGGGGGGGLGKQCRCKSDAAEYARRSGSTQSAVQ